MTPPGSSRRLYWILGIGLFASYAYFYQAGGWNQNSRFALVRAMTERNTLAIDGFHESTGDRAVWRGHFYSDKAPGVSLTAVIPVEAVRILNLAAGTDPDSDAAITRTSYVATVVVSGVFTVVAALCVAWLSLSWGYSRGAALFAATTYGVATPVWCYATLFMGHGLAAGCLMVAFTAAVALRDASKTRANQLAWAIGLFAGWAVVSEFQAAVPVLLITALAFTTISTSTLTAATRSVMTRVVVGGAIAGAMLVAYNTAAFGSPFHLGYASEEGFEQLQTGLFGISTPQLWRLREILIGSYRGLLPLSPLMALTPFGLALLARTRSRAWPAVVAATIVGYYLVLNASYFYWEGGWAFGPRQIMTAMPFLALGLAPLWDGWPSAGRIVLAIAWLWGAALTLVAVSTTPQPPGAVERPVTQLLLPAFRDGRLALNTQRFTDLRPADDATRLESRPAVSWNLGMKMGLTGLLSLVPLGIIWLACAGGLVWTLRSSSPPAARGSA
jgi:hypothetical protein